MRTFFWFKKFSLFNIVPYLFMVFSTKANNSFNNWILKYTESLFSETLPTSAGIWIQKCLQLHLYFLLLFIYLLLGFLRWFECSTCCLYPGLCRSCTSCMCFCSCQNVHDKCHATSISAELKSQFWLTAWFFLFFFVFCNAAQLSFSKSLSCDWNMAFSTARILLVILLFFSKGKSWRIDLDKKKDCRFLYGKTPAFGLFLFRNPIFK